MIVTNSQVAFDPFTGFKNNSTLLRLIKYIMLFTIHLMMSPNNIESTIKKIYYNKRTYTCVQYVLGIKNK